jgi:hypothetical protein
VFYRCAKLTWRWGIIQIEEVTNQLESVAKMWEARAASPPALPYPRDRSSTSLPDQSMDRLIPTPSGCDADLVLIDDRALDVSSRMPSSRCTGIAQSADPITDKEASTLNLVLNFL